MVLLYVIVAFIVVVLILHILILRTNYWNNRIEDMRCIPEKNEGRNYQICCLGGSSARYAYEFDNSIGVNLATNSQTLAYDLKMLNRYQSCLNASACVLVTFSDETLFMSEKNQKKNFKYIKCLNKTEIKKEGKLYFARNVYTPILFHPSMIKYVFHDVARYDKFSFDVNPCNDYMMADDCIRRMDLWEKEYHLSNSMEVEEVIKENLAILKTLIDTIRNLGAIPIFIVQPKSESCKMTIGDSYWPVDTYKIIQNLATQENIRIIDFSRDPEFAANTNYINALCYNSKGRKMISEELIKALLLSCMVSVKEAGGVADQMRDFVNKKEDQRNDL